MSVFDLIYENTSDSLDRAFIFAESELDITVMRANKDFYYESELIALNNDNIYTEATDVKNENAFVKAIKAIFNGIRKFFTTLGEAIAGLFDKRENVKPEDYFQSPNSKIRFDADVQKMDAAIDDEIRKGNVLLQKISSATGIDDAAIESWINAGKERLKSIAPVAIPAVAAFILNKTIPKMIKRKNNSVDEAERTVDGSNKNDPKKNQQKMTIINHISTLSKNFGNTVRGYANKLKENMIDPEYAKSSARIKEAAKKENEKYARGEISDDKHLSALGKLKNAEDRSKQKHNQRMAQRKDEKDKNNEAKSLFNWARKNIDKGISSGKFSKTEKDGLYTLIDKKHDQYKRGVIDFDTYQKAINNIFN